MFHLDYLILILWLFILQLVCNSILVCPLFFSLRARSMVACLVILRLPLCFVRCSLRLFVFVQLLVAFYRIVCIDPAASLRWNFIERGRGMAEVPCGEI